MGMGLAPPPGSLNLSHHMAVPSSLSLSHPGFNMNHSAGLAPTHHSLISHAAAGLNLSSGSTAAGAGGQTGASTSTALHLAHSQALNLVSPNGQPMTAHSHQAERERLAAHTAYLHSAAAAAARNTGLSLGQSIGGGGPPARPSLGAPTTVSSSRLDERMTKRNTGQSHGSVINLSSGGGSDAGRGLGKEDQQRHVPGGNTSNNNTNSNGPKDSVPSNHNSNNNNNLIQDLSREARNNHDVSSASGPLPVVPGHSHGMNEFGKRPHVASPEQQQQQQVQKVLTTSSPTTVNQNGGRDVSPMHNKNNGDRSTVAEAVLQSKKQIELRSPVSGVVKANANGSGESQLGGQERERDAVSEQEPNNLPVSGIGSDILTNVDPTSISPERNSSVERDSLLAATNRVTGGGDAGKKKTERGSLERESREAGVVTESKEENVTKNGATGVEEKSKGENGAKAIEECDTKAEETNVFEKNALVEVESKECSKESDNVVGVQTAVDRKESENALTADKKGVAAATTTAVSATQVATITTTASR